MLGDDGGLLTHERERIHLPAIADDLEMNVGSRGPPRGAHQRDRVTALDRLPYGNQRPLVVGIPGHIAVAMVDLDQVPVPRAVARSGDDASGDGHHVGASGAREIHALVISLLAGERIFAFTEVRRDET